MRDLITSAANPHVKRIRSLVRSRKERHHERMFVVEGVRLVEEALGHGAPDSLLYVSEQLEATARGRALLNRLQHADNAFPTTHAILAQVSDVETPQGVIAAAAMPGRLPAALDLILFLDGVQDPGNVGTLLRAAEACGIGLVVALAGTADPWSPKVVRAGMGAHFRLPLLDDVGWEEARARLGALPTLYAATQTSPTTYDSVDWRGPAGLVIGNEANGVSTQTLDLAQPITIPMLGAVESLNAAVAGSVIMFEAARQRRA